MLVKLAPLSIRRPTTLKHFKDSTQTLGFALALAATRAQFEHHPQNGPTQCISRTPLYRHCIYFTITCIVVHIYCMHLFRPINRSCFLFCWLWRHQKIALHYHERMEGLISVISFCIKVGGRWKIAVSFSFYCIWAPLTSRSLLFHR